MEFGSETWLLAEMPEARQHFFLFFPDFLFFTLLLSPLPRYREGGRRGIF
jgi:hypothetical protein